MNANNRIGEAFYKLTQTIAALRHPQTGCPWDLEQDHQSLRPYLIEEAHEVLQAIDRGNDPSLCDELGDLLLQAVLHAQIASERRAFSILEVVRAIDEKMIRRHPHVFSDAVVGDSADVLKKWEMMKKQEKGANEAAASPLPHSQKLAEIPLSLSALLRAQRIGEKAAQVGFDWECVKDVWEKVIEESEELSKELSEVQTLAQASGASKTAKRIADEQLRQRVGEELGDLLFSLCQLARWLGLSGEDCLRESSEKFIQRFQRLEASSKRPLEELSPAELEQLWASSKISS